MKTIIITNNTYLAEHAEDFGIDFIMVDLESEGKVERQKSRNTFISTHDWEDVYAVSQVISKKVNFIVRLNPCSERSFGELKKLKESQATHVMLPMIKTLKDVELFSKDMKALDVSFTLLPLIEHIDGLESLPEILKAFPEIKRVFFGLNDMSLSLKLPFLFQCITKGYMDRAAEITKGGGVAFGFGGVGFMGQDVAVAPELIVSEHARLGSDSVILSRAFSSGFDFLKAADGCPTQAEALDFKNEVRKVKTYFKDCQKLREDAFKHNHSKLCSAVEKVLTQ